MESLSGPFWIRWRGRDAKARAEIFVSGPRLVARAGRREDHSRRSLPARGWVDRLRGAARSDWGTWSIVDVTTGATLLETVQQGDPQALNTVMKHERCSAVTVSSGGQIIGRLEPGDDDGRMITLIDDTSLRYTTREAQRRYEGEADVTDEDGRVVVEVRRQRGVPSEVIPRDGLVGPHDLGVLPQPDTADEVAMLVLSAALLDIQFRIHRETPVQLLSDVSDTAPWQAPEGMSIGAARKAELQRTRYTHRDQFLEGHPDFAERRQARKDD